MNKDFHYEAYWPYKGGGFYHVFGCLLYEKVFLLSETASCPVERFDLVNRRLQWW